MQPDRVSRTHVVPGNIMSVEFKLFDIMTLKQFIYLVVCSFLSYIFISVLPDGIFKYLLSAVVMISGIIIAFVQFNGEPFEVYTSNFLLGIIQPQRRVWSKSLVKKTTPNPMEDDTDAPRKALRQISENYVPEVEVIPINYNANVTDMDLQESSFLKNNILPDDKRGSTSASLPRADLSKLNFDFALQSKQTVADDNTHQSSPLVDLKDISADDKSAIMMKDQISQNSIQMNTANEIDNANLNVNTDSMNPNNNINSSNISSKAPAFVIDMDDDHHDNKDTSNDNQPNQISQQENVPLTQNTKPQINLPEINFGLPNHAPSTNTDLNQSNLQASDINKKSGPLLEDLNKLNEIKKEEKSAKQEEITQMPAPIPQLDANQSKIHGKVISIDSTPMQGVVVTMSDTNGKALEAIITDDLGEFTFQSQPKTFQLKVYPPKKYLFSPMDKNTKEIIIHEQRNDKDPDVAKSAPGANDINFLNDAKEVNSTDSKIPNTINGVVKDDEGHYLSGVLVSIKDTSGTTIRALATNPLGQFFSLSPLQKGRYNIMFEKEGYTFDQYTVELEGKLYNAKVYLARKNR